MGLVGSGDGLARRQAVLAEAGIVPVPIAQNAEAEVLAGLNILFVAGLDRDSAVRLATLARGQGVLANVEDVPELCDFHVPAAIRRGDLVLTVSTGGRAPGLARIIREWLERKIGFEWNSRLNEIAATRAGWRAEGHAPAEVSKRLRNLVREREWLS